MSGKPSPIYDCVIPGCKNKCLRQLCEKHQMEYRNIRRRTDYDPEKHAPKFLCRDCGDQIHKDNSSVTKCKKCRQEYNRTKALERFYAMRESGEIRDPANLPPKLCKRCGKPIIGLSRQWVRHPDCAKEHKREEDRKLTKRIRRERLEAAERAERLTRKPTKIDPNKIEAVLMKINPDLVDEAYKRLHDPVVNTGNLQALPPEKIAKYWRS